jgi:hypothetical protein
VVRWEGVRLTPEELRRAWDMAVRMVEADEAAALYEQLPEIGQFPVKMYWT